MLKMNITKYDDLIKKLKTDKGPEPEIVLMSDYCKSDRQRVSVCLHRPNHIGKYHTHDFFEINYIHKGSCINLVEDDSILMNEGDMILIHPGAFHNLYADDESVVYNFLLDKKWFINVLSSLKSADGVLFDFFKAVDTENFYKYAVSHINDNLGLVKQKTGAIIDSSKNDSPWKYIKTETAILDFLEMLSLTNNNIYLSTGRGKSSNMMINILDYVTENCSTVNLDIMSEKFFYSKTHICRLFIKNTGKSFNEFLMDIKIGQACSMLENSNLTVDEIANNLGYKSVEYFYRLFKKKKGITPKEYRNQRTANS